MNLRLLFLTYFILETFFLIAQPQQRFAQQFNGNSVLLLADSSLLDAGSSFSLEAWVKPSALAPYAVIAGKSFAPRSNDPFQNFIIGLDGTGTKPEFVQTTGQSGSYRNATAVDPLPLNEWTHLVGVLESGQLKLYVNGALKAQSQSAGLPLSQTGISFGIGSGLDASKNTVCCGFKGQLMQLAFWSKSLSSAQVAERILSKPLQGTDGLSAFWDLNDSTGQILMDKSGNTLHLQRGNKEGPDAFEPIAVKIVPEEPYFELLQFSLPAHPFNPEDLIAIDFNNDSLTDLISTWLAWPPTYPASYSRVQAYKNKGNLQFEKVSVITGSDSTVHPRDFTVADYNGDGLQDLFIADHGTDVNPFPGAQNKLYLQTVNGTLNESGLTNLPALSDFSHHSAAGDIDRDGDMDIYVCNIFGQNNIGPYFLINNGAGVFTKSTNRVPANIANMNRRYISSRLLDMDKDGDCDLILGGHDGTSNAYDLILENDGNGFFSEGKFILPARAGAANWGSVCQVVADFTNDSYPDILFSPMNYQTCSLQLLVNNRNNYFGDSTKYFSQSWESTYTWFKWIEAGDFNQDGWLDFVIATHGKVPRLFINRGNARFEDASVILPPVDQIVSTRVRDFDRDGKPDIAFLQSSGFITILKNKRPYTVQIDSSHVITTGLINMFDTEKSEVYFYPNPAKDFLEIQFSKLGETAKVQVLNLQAQLIDEWEVSTEPKFRIELNKIPGGVYLLKILGKDSTNATIFKLIIE